MCVSLKRKRQNKAKGNRLSFHLLLVLRAAIAEHHKPAASTAGVYVCVYLFDAHEFSLSFLVKLVQVAYVKIIFCGAILKSILYFLYFIFQLQLTFNIILY